MAIGRRHPSPIPGLADKVTDPEVRAAFRLLEEWLRKLGKQWFIGHPAPHSATHASGSTDEFLHGDQHNPDGDDPLTTAAPSGDQFIDTPEEGTANAYARSDHQHSKPRATQVLSSYEFSSIEEDVKWAATRRSWVNVYSNKTFK